MGTYGARQAGITVTGLVVILVLVGFFGTIAARLVPVYVEHFTVLSSLQSLQEVEKIAEKSKGSIRALLMRRLGINNATNVRDEDVVITKKKGLLRVVVSYEARTKLVGNLDAVASFEDSIEVSAR
ncbi:MAG: DUF4845 domain-containing protein [Gammaproteobacteria bacterium]|nr:DUF4845 domain-containing protein [Gammaproteobacteria bacterium]